ncbi:hypothetical protein D3C81_1274810 [compost metagenome]
MAGCQRRHLAHLIQLAVILGAKLLQLGELLHQVFIGGAVFLHHFVDGGQQLLAVPQIPVTSIIFQNQIRCRVAGEQSVQLLQGLPAGYGNILDIHGAVFVDPLGPAVFVPVAFLGRNVVAVIYSCCDFASCRSGRCC